MDLFQTLDYAGVAVFAATGALAASRKQLDLIGFLFFAAMTGVGGGTVRDLLLDRTPFWIVEPTYMIVCASLAVLVYFTAHLVESRYKLLLWLDAIGLSAYSVLGAFKGFATTGSMTVSIVMGVLTATFGGILRDLLAGEPSVLLRPEIYVSAAMGGALVFTTIAWFGMSLTLAAGVGVTTAFLIRAGALRYGWTIPTYRSRPGRRPEDIG